MSIESVETTIMGLVDTFKQVDWVRAVGMSGGERPFPKPGEGDIDLFVYCNEIPGRSRSYALLSTLPESFASIDVGSSQAGHWGQADRCTLAGVEVWLLYFTVAEAQAELDGILSGRYLWRVDNYYYPLGRCAAWKTMRALYDPDGILQTFKTRLEDYPRELAKAVVGYHKAALANVEDLERAVQRKDVLFYHFAFDLALDHFLQILFAVNKTYFPSRKRSLQYLQGFAVKPQECEQRLLRAAVRGGDASTLGESYAVWQDLLQDLNGLMSG